MSNKTKNNYLLLNSLVNDEKKINRKLYSAGPYWGYKTKKILHSIKKVGINDFRGFDSGVGSSYTDNIILDYRNELGIKGRILSLITHFPLINKIFNGQVNLTFSTIKKYIQANAKCYENNEKVKYLIEKYKIENSTGFGCKLKFQFKKKEYSCHYLDMCERIDTINKFINFEKIHTFFEIGGGFGSNVHLLLSNFKNIKKVIYLDIVPNLFVGTEYLRSFYGDSVKDYNFLKNKNKISFSNNDELEIFCLAPWQIENISAVVDHFHNSASFQEMPENVIKNYVKYIFQLFYKNISISLISYDGWNKNNTLDPKTLNNLFGDRLVIKEIPELVNTEKKNFYLISQ